MRAVAPPCGCTEPTVVARMADHGLDEWAESAVPPLCDSNHITALFVDYSPQRQKLKGTATVLTSYSIGHIFFHCFLNMFLHSCFFLTLRGMMVWGKRSWEDIDALVDDRWKDGLCRWTRMMMWGFSYDTPLHAKLPPQGKISSATSGYCCSYSSHLFLLDPR